MPPTLKQRGLRTGVMLIPLLLAVLHALGFMPTQALHRLDNAAYDLNLRATLPGTLESRVAIVDIDSPSLAAVGPWPWPRAQLARLVDTLFEQQQIAVLGFDIVFPQPDPQAGGDAAFAAALRDRPVVLGYFFSNEPTARNTGVLPAPVMSGETLQGRSVRITRWDTFESNIPELAQAAPRAGAFNALPDSDGVVRSVPLLAEHQGQAYESLALAVFRRVLGSPSVEPGFATGAMMNRRVSVLESLRLQHKGQTLAIPVDERVSALVPYRGRGGPQGGSFTYVSATDLLSGRVPPAQLQGRIVLMGTTAPELKDLRLTPVGANYPGVEAHANMLSAFLDGKSIVRPDYAVGFDAAQLLCTGALLAIALPLLSATWAVLLSVAVVAMLAGVNLWLYLAQGLALPLATVTVMAIAAFALNMVYGYFVESRAKRELAALFGTYVPPELVDEMLKHPEHYGMQAANRELTVMFCDMRGFTALSECMPPLQLQALLNGVFTRLTRVIQSQRGTIDKYMGDCVMAFWGAPVPAQDHAACAVRAAMGMAQAMQQLNQEHRAQGLPEVGVGIGLNTGTMCVGDMGSDIRLSYTVIGDAVNLGSRLEGLSKTYGVAVIASEFTQAQAPGFLWQELDRVRVKGKAQAVAIYTPVSEHALATPGQTALVEAWRQFLTDYRAQDWAKCIAALQMLLRSDPQSTLYALYAERLQMLATLPHQPNWDGATNFDTK